MPMRDMTGPRGRGPRTGRGMGPCNPDYPVYDRSYGYGYGYGGRRGRRGMRGRGFDGYRAYGFGGGYGYGYAPEFNQEEILPADRKEILARRKAYLQERLAAVEQLLAQDEKEME
ncbi:MAG: DUF5320 family protein [Firmicutes bacterium]|nr:DUF5320 family protein [Bacillota bacterium]